MILGFSRLFWLSFFFFVALFISFPEIDIWFSSLFFKDKEFFLKHHFLADLVYDFTHPLIILYFLIFVIFLFKNPFNLKKRAIIFVLLCIVIAPGVVVNLGFKDHFGRARPKNIIEFNGDKKFTPAFIISDQCKKNCSFTCGHAGAGFSLMAIAFLFSQKRRKKFLIFGAFVGFLIGFVRIIQGGHFLSDVIFSFFIVYFVIKILYLIVVEVKK